MNMKYDGKYLYEIEFKDKNNKSFPYKLFYLIPDNINKNIKELLIKEFTRNIKLFKFFNDNKITVKKFKVFIVDAENCFASNFLLNNNMIKKNELYSNNKEDNLKVFYINNLKINEYLKNIILFYNTEEEINIDIEDFSNKELILIRELYLKSLFEIMNNLKDSLIYDKDYNVYYFKFKQLIMLQTRLKKIKLIDDFIKQKGNKNDTTK